MKNLIFLKKKNLHFSDTKVKSITRLETFFAYDNPDKITRLILGDATTTASYSMNSSRFLGIKYGTNFSIRPDLTTKPLMDFAGIAELPSSIEIYRNSIALYKGQLNMGKFEFYNIPLINGKGELTVNTLDISGKMTNITIPYYSDYKLLKAGLQNHSLEFGIQRQNFAQKSNYYKHFITNYIHMYGFSERNTGGIQFQSLNRYSTFGITSLYQLGVYGVISLSIAQNLHQLKKASKTIVSYNYQDKIFNFYLSFTKNRANYKNVYNKTLDNNKQITEGYKLKKTPTKLQYQLSVGYNNEIFGGIFFNILSYTNFLLQKPMRIAREVRYNILSTSYTKSVGQNYFFYFTIGTTIEQKKKENFGYFSLGLNLDFKSISLSKSRFNKQKSEYINLNSNSKQYLGIDYNIDIIHSKTIDYNVQLTHNSNKNTNTISLYKSDKNQIIQVGTKGSIIAIEKSLLFSRTIYDAFALVKVSNLPNTPVYYHNVLVGNTNKYGSLIIPNIISYNTSIVKIDEQNLPINTTFTSLTKKISPKWRNATQINFFIKKQQSAILTLVDSQNKPLSSGHYVNILNLEDEMFTGDNGKLYISDITELKNLNGKACYGDNCCIFFIKINQNNLNEILIDLGEVLCKNP